MSSFKYPPEQLPGEAQYRNHQLQIIIDELKAQRKYREYGMDTGTLRDDIDLVVSDEELDFMAMRFLEYTKQNQLVKNHAILEMKHFRVKTEVTNHILYDSTAGLELANAANLPYFLVKYFPEDEMGNWEFSVYPINAQARAKLKGAKQMSNRDYLRFLYDLRGLPAPEHMLAQRSTVKHSLSLEIV